MTRIFKWLLVITLATVGGCTLSEKPRTDRDPYTSDSSSDPGIRVGNPY